LAISKTSYTKKPQGGKTPEAGRRSSAQICGKKSFANCYLPIANCFFANIE
jgi:hypothetical protein